MLSVILPTYNEASNIAPLIQAIREVLASSAFEIIVVDDDSPDETWKRVETTADLKLLRRIRQRGLTTAISDGIKASRGDLVGWLDSDWSTPPELIPKLAAKVAEGFDVAVASRYVPGGRDARTGSFSRRVASRIIVELSRALLSRDFHDYTSGYIVARRHVLDAIPLRGDYGEYFIDFIFRALCRGYRIAEVPYVVVPRRSGESKTEAGFFRKGVKYLATIARLRLEKLAGRLPS